MKVGKMLSIKIRLEIKMFNWERQWKIYTEVERVRAGIKGFFLRQQRQGGLILEDCLDVWTLSRLVHKRHHFIWIQNFIISS